MIVITTPTGAIGHQVLESILNIGGQPVRVILRDPAKLPAPFSDRIEVVQGSHGDADVVNEAFKGAEAVFWLAPPNPRTTSLEATYLDFTRPACEAIRNHRVKRVISVSALGRGTPFEKTAGLVTASLAMDDLLASTGAHCRALAMPSFMDNFLRQVPTIKGEGVFFSPIAGDLKSPTCATRDIASAAVKLLLDWAWTGTGSVPVLGPEDLSFNDMASILSEVLGKAVRYQQIPFDAFEARLKESGMSDAFIRGYVDMMKAKNQGLDNAEPRTAESSTPTSFRTWCEDVLKPAVLN